MYGSDTSQVGALAATGIAVGVTGQVIAAAVIIIAGLALLTIVKVVRTRKTKAARG